MREHRHMPRALITGWFTFDEVIATVGDLVGGEVVERWLREAGFDCDVAIAQYMGYGVDWRAVEPADYDLLVFTTGPLVEHPSLLRLVERFNGVTRWAVNVSAVDAATAGAFDRIWWRDAAGITRPDLAFGAPSTTLPLVAVAYAPGQPEYSGGRHEEVADAISEWLATRPLAAVELDMDMFAAHRFPRRAAHVESIIARADLVVSMRLHATVLALKHGRPVIAVDPVVGGAKVRRQAASVRWPLVVLANAVGPAELDAAFEYCLSSAAATRVAASRRTGEAGVAGLGVEFRAAAQALLGDA